MNVISFIATGVTLVAVLGGLSAYFGKSRGDAIISYQATENGLLKGTIARLEKDGAAKDARITALEEQNATLKELAQGSPQLAKLTEQIKALVDIVGRRK